MLPALPTSLLPQSLLKSDAVPKTRHTTQDKGEQETKKGEFEEEKDAAVHSVGEREGDNKTMEQAVREEGKEEEEAVREEGKEEEEAVREDETVEEAVREDETVEEAEEGKEEEEAVEEGKGDGVVILDIREDAPTTPSHPQDASSIAVDTEAALSSQELVQRYTLKELKQLAEEKGISSKGVTTKKKMADLLVA